MIKLQNLSAGYSQRKPVLQGLTTALHPGRIYGLLGANGSGKTTLLKTLSGCISSLAGEISVLGHNPILREKSLLADIAYMPDEIVMPAISAKAFGQAYAPFWPQFSSEKFHDFLNRFECDTTTRLNRLSLGNRKKFFLSFILACNTRLLLLDEPTNGLDILGKRVFRQILASEINEERTVVVSTHLISDLENLLSDVIIINDNRMAINATIDNVAERLEFGSINDIANPIYKEGLSAIGINEGEPTGVDLEMLYLALHDRSANQQIIDLVSGKEELC